LADYVEPAPAGPRAAVPAAGRLEEALTRLLSSPNLRSRRFAFRQYDSTVQGNTVLGPGAAAAVVRVETTCMGLALTTDCNPRLTRLDPRRGAAQAVAEAARNLACVGAEPIAVTDCLNFGNPEKRLVAWQLTQAVAGLAEACRAFEVPVVSGNVSLYNEAAGRAIPPTPTVGMVGLLQDVGLRVPTEFSSGNAVVLLGELPRGLGSSEYLPESSVFPRFDLDAERRLCLVLRRLAADRLIASAQDVSDGGLAVALSECALLGWCGVVLEVRPTDETMLFSEDQGRAIVSCRPAVVPAVLAASERSGVPALVIGRTGGEHVQLGGVRLGLDRLQLAWAGGEP
jgi:phosphoribosylformylglycinamidine synthase